MKVNYCSFQYFTLDFKTKTSYNLVYFTGNIVEWCYPNDVDLDTLEFKAMPSGAHKITSDFM